MYMTSFCSVVSVLYTIDLAKWKGHVAQRNPPPYPCPRISKCYGQGYSSDDVGRSSQGVVEFSKYLRVSVSLCGNPYRSLALIGATNHPVLGP